MKLTRNDMIGVLLLVALFALAIPVSREIDKFDPPPWHSER